MREVPEGFLVFSSNFSFEFPNREHIYIRKLSAEGVYQYQLDHWPGDDRRFDIGYIDAVASNADGTFSAVIAEGRSYDSEKWLYHFDQTGDTIGRHFMLTYPVEDSIVLGVRQIRPTLAGGHVWCGFLQRAGQSADAFLCLVDADGDTLWTRRYDAPGQAWEALGVAQYTDGGFLITGGWQGPPSIDRAFLIRTDADGNELWRRLYADRADLNGAVRVAADGNILTWCEYREPQWGFYWQQMMLTKWDPDGEIIWQRKVGYNYYVGTYDLEVLADGSIVGSGTTLLNGVLMKFSAEGDSLWSRSYSYTNDFSLFFDVEPTSDGGFVCTGYARRSLISDPQFLTSQMIWVVKTDSLGCVVPGCQSVGVEEYMIDLNEHLRIWPNPLARGTPLSIAFTPPPTFTPNGPLRVVVQDAMGRQVHEERVQVGTGQLANLPTGQAGLPLAAGLYHLHLTDGTRWLAGCKVVVE